MTGLLINDDEKPALLALPLLMPAFAPFEH
jgi:hypothetical protein